MVSIQELRKHDAATKPADADNEWRRAAAYYYDQSRGLTITSLRALGLGIPSDTRPLEVGLLPRLVERLAILYDRPPTRWLTRGRERLAEDDPELQAVLDLYTRMSLDMKLREADRLSALYRQCLVRVYPVDSLSAPVVRLFPPQCILRAPSGSTPDLIQEDDAFALLLSGEPEKPNATWEKWEKTGGVWTFGRVDGKDNALSEVMVSPYPVLPAMMVYDADPCGSAWLPPRASRIAYIEKLAQAANDLAALVRAQAHDQRVVSTNRGEDVPEEGGPGSTWILPKDAEASLLSSNPKIAESIQVMEAELRLFVLSEALPLSEFDAAAPALTGAALRVQQHALLSRRAAQVPMAVANERALFRMVRGVYNAHAETWGAVPLAEDTDLSCEIADVDIPVDPREQQEAAARGIALGTMSVIDAIQAQNRCTRSEAIAIFKRVEDDRARYPVAISEAGALQTSTRLAGVDAGEGGASSDVAPSVLPDRPDLRGKASVVQAIEAMA